MIFRPVIAIAFLTPLLALSAQGLRADDGGTRETLKMQRQQQIDAMSLSIGQSLTNAQAANLDHRQRLQLQQLELQQQMQQQQIEQQRFGRERRQQLQQFEWERRQQLQQLQWERQQQLLMKPLAPPLFTIH